jgi:hypothetical protein
MDKSRMYPPTPKAIPGFKYGSPQRRRNKKTLLREAEQRRLTADGNGEVLVDCLHVKLSGHPNAREPAANIRLYDIAGTGAFPVATGAGFTAGCPPDLPRPKAWHARSPPCLAGRRRWLVRLKSEGQPIPCGRKKGGRNAPLEERELMIFASVSSSRRCRYACIHFSEQKRIRQ